jgi:hypothetical protein
MGENLVETFIPARVPGRSWPTSFPGNKGTGNVQLLSFHLITRPGNRIEILLNATPRFGSIREDCWHDWDGQVHKIYYIIYFMHDINETEPGARTWVLSAHWYSQCPNFRCRYQWLHQEWNQKIEAPWWGTGKRGHLRVPLWISFKLSQKSREIVDAAYWQVSMWKKWNCPWPPRYCLAPRECLSKKDVGRWRPRRRRWKILQLETNGTSQKEFLGFFSFTNLSPLNGVLACWNCWKKRRWIALRNVTCTLVYVSGSSIEPYQWYINLSKISWGMEAAFKQK